MKIRRFACSQLTPLFQLIQYDTEYRRPVIVHADSTPAEGYALAGWAIDKEKAFAYVEAQLPRKTR